MTPLSFLLDLVKLSVRNPKEGAARVLALGLSRQAIWISLAITLTLGTILGYVHEAVTPDALGPDGEPIRLPDPFVSVIVTAVLLVALDFVIAQLGRGFGGTGGFFDILLVDVWLRVIALFAMVIDIIAFLISPELGQLVLFATYLYLLWLMLNFVAVAHGGISLGKSFLVIFLSGMIAFLPFLLLLGMVGLAPNIGA